MKCWEYYDCKFREDCPAFIQNREDCWNVEGTRCGAFLDRTDPKKAKVICPHCVFRKQKEASEK